MTDRILSKRGNSEAIKKIDAPVEPPPRIVSYGCKMGELMLIVISVTPIIAMFTLRFL